MALKEPLLFNNMEICNVSIGHDRNVSDLPLKVTVWY